MRPPLGYGRPPHPPTMLTPRQQLRAGRLGRRLPQLAVGLVLYGLSMAMMVRADLGLAPWDVLHIGLESHFPLTFGQITMAVGALVLALWWPLRQWPGLGTLANVVVIGLVSDLGLALLPAPDPLAGRVVLLLGRHRAQRGRRWPLHREPVRRRTP